MAVDESSGGRREQWPGIVTWVVVVGVQRMTWRLFGGRRRVVGDVARVERHGRGRWCVVVGVAGVDRDDDVGT